MGLVDLRCREVVTSELAAARRELRSLPPESRAPVLAVLAFDELATGTAQRAAAFAEDALDQGRVLEALPAEHPAVFFSISTLIVTDRRRDAEGHLEEASRRAAGSGSVRARAAVSVLRSLGCFRWGRISEAEAEARTAVRLTTEHGWDVGRALAVATLLDPLIERGELDEAKHTMRLIDPAEEDPEAHSSQQWRESAARLHLELGRPAQALEAARECARWERTWGARNAIFVHYAWRSTAALAHLALGEPARARELASEQAEIAEAFGDPHAIGTAHRVAGLAHEDERRLAHLHRAVEALDGSCSRLEHAKALADLGTALRVDGRRREAREPLSAALDLAHRCGASALEERAREELRVAGARRRTPLLTGIEALTPSERRVTAMAAEGLSNPEIAQALFVTRKTVEMHLSNAYRKLDVGGRDELDTVLAAD